jgi:hypothetical protein
MISAIWRDAVLISSMVLATWATTARLWAVSCAAVVAGRLGRPVFG